jgi:hypothetical protein
VSYGLTCPSREGLTLCRSSKHLTLNRRAETDQCLEVDIAKSTVIVGFGLHTSMLFAPRRLRKARERGRRFILRGSFVWTAPAVSIGLADLTSSCLCSTRSLLARPEALQTGCVARRSISHLWSRLNPPAPTTSSKPRLFRFAVSPRRQRSGMITTPPVPGEPGQAPPTAGLASTLRPQSQKPAVRHRSRQQRRSLLRLTGTACSSGSRTNRHWSNGCRRTAHARRTRRGRGAARCVK